MIELQDLAGFNEKGIVDVLLDQGKQPFEIYVPKSTQLYFTETWVIADEYRYLAYAGNMLKQVSDSFEYEEVPPEEHKSIQFIVTCKDLNKLAAAILMLTYYDINDHEDADFIFLEEVEAYFDDLENGKIEPACPYFINTYLQLLSEIKQEEEN